MTIFTACLLLGILLLAPSFVSVIVQERKLAKLDTPPRFAVSSREDGGAKEKLQQGYSPVKAQFGTRSTGGGRATGRAEHQKSGRGIR